MNKLFSAFGGMFLCLMIGAASVAAQDTPKTINGGVVNGKAISLPKPEYPEEARKANVGGIVKVEVIIDEAGRVISASVVQGNQKVYKADGAAVVTETEDAPEMRLLYEAAENAARMAIFSPASGQGEAVKVKGVIVYNFVAGGIGDGKSISGGVLNGKAVSLPKPVYPADAKAEKASGAVTVQVIIDEEGNVISAKAVSGHPLLRAASENAAREAKFNPTTLSGQPVKVSGVVVYNFAL